MQKIDSLYDENKKNLEESNGQIIVPAGYVDVPADGWCFYHAIAQALGKPREVERIHDSIINEIVNNPYRYKDFVPECDGGLDAYVCSHAETGVNTWADGIIPQAAAAALGVQITINRFDIE